MPAGPQRHQLRLRRYSRDAYAVVSPRADDSRDRRSVLLRDVRAAIDEISRDSHSSGKIRMVGLDSGVDLRDAHVPTRGDLMKLGQMPRLGTGLQRIKGIVVGEHVKQAHRLR